MSKKRIARIVKDASLYQSGRENDYEEYTIRWSNKKGLSLRKKLQEQETLEWQKIIQAIRDRIESDHIHEYLGIGYYTSELHGLIDDAVETYLQTKGGETE